MMKTLQPIKYELFKMSRRIEIYIFFGVLIFLSAIFAHLFGINSNVLILSGTKKIGGVLFYMIIYSFLASLLLFPLIIISSTAAVWATELTSGTIAYSIVWMESRTNIFVTKCLNTIMLTIVYNFFLIVSSVFLFLMLGKSGEMYSSEIFYGVGNQVFEFIFIAIMYSVFLSALSTLYSMFGNTSMTIIGGVATIIILKILEQVDYIKRYLPTYIINPTNVLDKAYKINDLYMCIIYTILLSGGIYVLAYSIFKRKNIK